ncbi:MAG: septal ring lytic transglycosylase RlpA family protein [Bradyrhizobiaceae bacterium]|nr:septal ring lytic transglycosylase RlpA family protein [Bradyrhizobiaceae bacterium]
MGRNPNSKAESALVESAPSALRRLPVARLASILALGLFLANCTAGPIARLIDPKYGVPASPRVVEEGQPVPKGGGYYRVGDAYTVGGRTYVPEHNPAYRAEGLASWYGRDFHGRLTANREVFDMDAISAAHPTLPIPSYARVTNLANRRSLIVRVNDRGPFKEGRIVDVSYKAAELLGFHKNGIARVRVEYVGPAALEGSDDRKLIATLRSDGQPAPAPSAVMVAAGGPFVPVANAPLPDRQASYVPAPPERPFDLGRYPAAPASSPASPGTQLASAAPPVTRASYTEPGSGNAARLAPVSGYAPAMVTGRGLY